MSRKHLGLSGGGRSLIFDSSALRLRWCSTTTALVPPPDYASPCQVNALGASLQRYNVVVQHRKAMTMLMHCNGFRMHVGIWTAVIVAGWQGKGTQGCNSDQPRGQGPSLTGVTCVQSLSWPSSLLCQLQSVNIVYMSLV